MALGLLATFAMKRRTTPILLLLPLISRPLLHPSSSSSYIYISHSYFSATDHQSFIPPSSSRTQFFKHHLFPLKPSTFNLELELDQTNHSTLVETLRKTKEFTSETEAMDFLDKVEEGVQLDCSLVCSVVWALRNEWELALLGFKWGQKLGCIDSSAWDLMVLVLGQNKRFGTAWCLIRNMHRSSLNVRRALLIMIECYAVADCPGKSIQTFKAMEKFRISQDSKALDTLLHSLCKNGNIEEAEEFMQQNKNLLPLRTETFNIILNGWCNISLDLVEAKRVWREMSNCCLMPDAVSYSHMISCFSRVGDLFHSLRLYDEMKKRGWIPDLDVYNSLIYVLTRENCLNEAFNIVDKIKEAGLLADSTTYNSMILPLCEAHNLEEAKSVFATMASMGLDPTSETYHAFLQVESVDATVELLKQMREAGYGPDGHTFLLILRKLLKSKQPDNALRMWVEMMRYEIVPDSGHYSVMVRGLSLCGWLAKARKFYDDMKSRGFPDDPKLEKVLKDPVGSVGEFGKQQGRHREEDTGNRRQKGCKGRRKVQKRSTSSLTT
ncbi:hypothetical protein IFM89_010486 [Coptis chinensis]|uniref:Pentatricopeptide repeat-containing protein n=1 Tax=Coptis chinensis TaxID=261450 RepID=A0A835I9K1_9MAGN|nr:hypothetical protein IFM89_010486 [Coptis chinensis]